MRSHCPFLSLLLVAVVTCVAQFDRTRITFDEPHTFPNGILVLSAGETQRHAATWTILITLDAPKLEIDLHESLQRIRSIIASLHDHRGSNNDTRILWEGCIQEIEDTMIGYMSERVRPRRGLLNVIGNKKYRNYSAQPLKNRSRSAENL